MSTDYLAISVADIHGNKTQYEKIKQIVKEQSISFVFMCGDLLPKTGGTWTPENKVRTIQMQADFINEYFLQYLTELSELAAVYAIFGNDDFKSNYHLVQQAQIPNVTFLDREVVKLAVGGQEAYVAGYPYVGITPFLHKDWEVWDDRAGDVPHKLYRTDGYASGGGVHKAVDLQESARTIADELEELSRLSDPTKTVYIFHEAPHDTPLDMIAPDNKYIKDDLLHIGSKAMREFVEQKQPLVTMHGHIHETYDESGDFKWQSGASVSLTAANDFAKDELKYVKFPLFDPATAERLTA